MDTTGLDAGDLRIVELLSRLGLPPTYDNYLAVKDFEHAVGVDAVANYIHEHPDLWLAVENEDGLPTLVRVEIPD